jgi:hypothetical protein
VPPRPLTAAARARRQDRTGVMMLAILTGFRDVNQALNLPPPAAPASAPDCDTWVERKRGWDAVARCLQWSACDDASTAQAEDIEAAQAFDPTPSPPLSRSCARLRCICTSVPLSLSLNLTCLCT